MMNNDVHYWLNTVKFEGMKLADAPLEIRSNPEVVLVAVMNDGEALQYASKALCDHKQIVLEAVACDPSALAYASQRLRDDEEVVLLAVNANAYTLEFASERLRADREVVLEAVRRSDVALPYASPPLWDDQEIILAAIAQDEEGFDLASDRLKADRLFVTLAITENVMVLDRTDFRYDAAICHDAIQIILAMSQRHIDTLENIPNCLKHHQWFWDQMVEANLSALKFAPKAVQNKCYERGFNTIRQWARVMLWGVFPKQLAHAKQSICSAFFHDYPGLKKFIGSILLSYVNPLASDTLCQRAEHVQTVSMTYKSKVTGREGVKRYCYDS